MVLTYERLRAALHYDPETGAFTRLSSSSKKSALLIGKAAGGKNALGYWQVGIDRVLYLGHRLAWFYMTGEWPSHEVDHRDMDRANNRWPNLRSATKSNNSQNRGAQANNLCGLKGVAPIGKRWRATITVDGQQKHLGCRATPEEAHALYVAAAGKYHGEFARTA